MLTFYWFAFIVGGGLLLFSIFGDVAGADVDDPGGEGNALKFLSLRTATYFLFGFGASGLSLSWLSRGGPIATVVIAAATGAAAAWVASVLLGYLRRTESGEREDESSFVGLAGNVTLPLAAGRSGRVMVQRGPRSYELRARPFDPVAAEPDSWKQVVVIDMVDGTALVAPVDAAMDLPESGPVSG